MDRRRLLTLLSAALLGLVGIIAVLAYVHGAYARAIGKTKPGWALTAKEAIPAGTSASAALRNRMLLSVRYPKGALPVGYVRHLSRQGVQGSVHVGSAARRDRSGGHVRPKRAGGISSRRAGEPRRARPGGVSDASGGRLYRSGSKVAVYNIAGQSQPLESSCSSHQPPAGGTVATVVLPSVEVLAVQTSGGTSGSCASAGGGELCVIVAVPTAVSLRLADVAATGDLELVLLSDNSALPSPTARYTSP